MKNIKLNNGLNIYTEEINSKTFTFSFYVCAGSYREINFKPGIAHFLEHLIFKGTETRSAQQLMQEIEEIGGIINAETGFQHTRYYVTVPSEHWKIAVDIISDIIIYSNFPKKEIELERTVVQEELKMYWDDASSHVVDILISSMHKSYPNRQLIGGTVKSVGEISRSQILEFKDQFYTSNNSFIVATGSLPIGLLDFINLKFKKLKKGKVKESEKFYPDFLDSDIEIQRRPNMEQSHFAWGLFGPTTDSEDYYAMNIIISILCSGFTSRLYQLIREQMGLCYTINLSYQPMKDSGLIIGYSGLQENKIEEVREIVVQQFELLTKEKVSEKELQKAKEYTKGKHIISLERPSAINDYIGSAIIDRFSTNPDEFISNIMLVSQKDIMRAAKKYFIPDNWKFAKIIPKN